MTCSCNSVDDLSTEGNPLGKDLGKDSERNSHDSCA